MEAAESRTRLLDTTEPASSLLQEQLPHYYKRALIGLYVIECACLVKYIFILLTALTFHTGDRAWALVLLSCSLVGVILLSYSQSNGRHQLHVLTAYLIIGLVTPLTINIFGVPEVLRITAELLKNKNFSQVFVGIVEVIGLVVWVYYYTLAIYVVIQCILFYLKQRNRSRYQPQEHV